MMMPPSRLHALSLLSLWITTASSFHGGPKIFAVSRMREQHLNTGKIMWRIPRGGSNEGQTLDNDEEDSGEDISEEEGSEEEDEEESDDTEESPLASVISSEPVAVTIKTNLGNPLIDQSIELLVSRTRNVASVKQALSRQLPGRPPVTAISLMSGTRVLGDDELVDELVEDEDDDDDDDEEKSSSLVLILDMVPPVDPKFATSFQKLNEMTTSEILDAYAANAASMYHNAQSLVSEPSADKAYGSLSVQLRHEAYRIRNQLTSSFPESALEKLEQETPPHETQVSGQRRGQRYRSGRGGAKTNIKRMIQRNLNVVCIRKIKLMDDHLNASCTHSFSFLLME